MDGTGKTLLPGSDRRACPRLRHRAARRARHRRHDRAGHVHGHRGRRAPREEQAAGKATDARTSGSAGTLATAPGGHGTEYGMAIPTIAAPAEAQAFVDARIAEGSDYIKIVYDDGHAYGLTHADPRPGDADRLSSRPRTGAESSRSCTSATSGPRARRSRPARTGWRISSWTASPDPGSGSPSASHEGVRHPDAERPGVGGLARRRGEAGRGSPSRARTSPGERRGT